LTLLLLCVMMCGCAEVKFRFPNSYGVLNEQREIV
jgi:hypothetical protein